MYLTIGNWYQKNLELDQMNMKIVRTFEILSKGQRPIDQVPTCEMWGNGANIRGNGGNEARMQQPYTSWCVLCDPRRWPGAQLSKSKPGGWKTKQRGSTHKILMVSNYFFAIIIQHNIKFLETISCHYVTLERIKIIVDKSMH